MGNKLINKIMTAVISALLIYMTILLCQMGLIEKIINHPYEFIASMIFLILFIGFMYLILYVSARNIYVGTFMTVVAMGLVTCIRYPEIALF